ncbi:hypothetical protein ACLBR5_19950 [Escherichia coli]
MADTRPGIPDEQPTAPLARYIYTAGGELRAVYDRSGMVRGLLMRSTPGGWWRTIMRGGRRAATGMMIPVG